MPPNNQPTTNYHPSQPTNPEPELMQTNPTLQPPTPLGNAPYAVDQSAKPQPVSKLARRVLASGLIILTINLTMLLWCAIVISSKTPSLATGPAIFWGTFLLLTLPVEIIAIFSAIVHLAKGLTHNTLSGRDIATSVGGIILCLLPALFILFLFMTTNHYHFPF